MDWQPIETAPRKCLIDLLVGGRRITGWWNVQALKNSGLGVTITGMILGKGEEK